MCNDVVDGLRKTARAATIGLSRTRKGLLLAPLCLLAIPLGAVFVWLFVAGPNDPVYEGRRLSSWLQKYPHTPPQPVDPPGEGMRLISVEETERHYRRHFGKDVAAGYRALLAIGGDALPLLVQMLGSREKLPRWRFVIAENIPIGMGGYRVQREQAITALLDLQRGGCKLGPIMPQIERLIKDSDGEVSKAATFLVEMFARDEKIRLSADGVVNAAALESRSEDEANASRMNNTD